MVYGITTTQYYSCSQAHLCGTSIDSVLLVVHLQSSRVASSSLRAMAPRMAAVHWPAPSSSSPATTGLYWMVRRRGRAQRRGHGTASTPSASVSSCSSSGPLPTLKVLRVEAWLAGNWNRADAHVYCAFNTNNVNKQQCVHKSFMSRISCLDMSMFGCYVWRLTLKLC